MLFITLFEMKNGTGLRISAPLAQYDNNIKIYELAFENSKTVGLSKPQKKTEYLQAPWLFLKLDSSSQNFVVLKLEQLWGWVHDPGLLWMYSDKISLIPETLTSPSKKTDK